MKKATKIKKKKCHPKKILSDLVYKTFDSICLMKML